MARSRNVVASDLGARSGCPGGLVSINDGIEALGGVRLTWIGTDKSQESRNDEQAYLHEVFRMADIAHFLGVTPQRAQQMNQEGKVPDLPSSSSIPSIGGEPTLEGPCRPMADHECRPTRRLAARECDARDLAVGTTRAPQRTSPHRRLQLPAPVQIEHLADRWWLRRRRRHHHSLQRRPGRR